MRANNEDAVVHFTVDPGDSGPAVHLYVVADGMGGHRAGQTASAMAVASAREVLASMPLEDLGRSLDRLFRRINVEVIEAGRSDPELRGMGTTLTILAIRGCQAWIGHVGDSRVYRIRAQRMEQLTQDDTLVARLARQGMLSDQEAARHPDRNLLVQAIGGQESVVVQVVGPIGVEDDDRFLLCTDGLFDVDDQTIANTVLLNDPQTACGLLVRLANATGGTDNTTVQVVHCVRVESSNGSRR